MRLHLAITLFVAARLCCVAASPVHEGSKPQNRKQKCSRMLPWTGSEGVRSCQYLCRGWPFRYENEPDGLSCKNSFPSVCLKGKCVDIDVYVAADSKTPSHSDYLTTYVNSQATPKSPTSTDAPFANENTVIGTDYTHKLPSTQLHAATRVMWYASRQTTRQQSFITPQTETFERHSEGALFSTGSQAPITGEDSTTPRTPALREELSTASADTAPKEIVTSSSHQDARLPSSTEDTNTAEVTLNRTQDAGRDVASTSPNTVTSAHEGNTRADHGDTPTYANTHQNSGFTDGSTTESRRLLTSSGTSTEEFTSRPMHADAHFNPESEEISGVRGNTHQASPSTYESTETATSNSKQYSNSSLFPPKYNTATEILNENDSAPVPPTPALYLPNTISLTSNETRATSAANDNISDVIVSSHTTQNDDSSIGSTNAPTHNVFTNEHPDGKQTVTDTDEEDITTTSSETLTDSSTLTEQHIASYSTNTVQSSTTMSYAPKVVPNISNSLVPTEESSTTPGSVTFNQSAYADVSPTSVLNASVSLEEDVSTHHLTTPDQDFTSYAKSNNEKTSSSSANIDFPSSKEMDAEVVVSGSTSKQTTTEPVTADSVFTTDQHYSYTDEEKSTPAILNEIVSAHNQSSPNFGLPTSTVSILETSASTSVRAEWPSNTEKAAPEEGSTINNQDTTTQNVPTVSAFFAPEHYTEGRSPSHGVQSIATTLVNGSTRRSATLLPKATTLFLSSSKQAKATPASPAHTGSSSAEMGGLSELEGSNQQEISAGTVSTAASSTEKDALEEWSTNQDTTTQNVPTVSTFSTSEHYTEGRSSSRGVQSITTTLIDGSTRRSGTLPPRGTTLFPQSSKQAKSTPASPAHTGPCSTEMRGLSELEGSSEHKISAGRVSTAAVTAASMKHPASTTSLKNKASSGTREKGDNPHVSSTTSLPVTTSPLSISQESKSDSTSHRLNVLLSGFCALCLLIPVFI